MAPASFLSICLLKKETRLERMYIVLSVIHYQRRNGATPLPGSSLYLLSFYLPANSRVVTVLTEMKDLSSHAGLVPHRRGEVGRALPFRPMRPASFTTAWVLEVQLRLVQLLQNLAFRTRAPASLIER